MLLRSAVTVCALAVAIALAAPAYGAQPEPPALAEARSLLAHGKADGALARLKAAREAGETGPTLDRLLGIAYLKAGNRFWAVRSLAACVAADPDDCEARCWLGQARIEAGFLDEAAAVVDHPGCDADTPSGVRWRLLRARVAGLRGDDAAAGAEIAKARASASAWPEDRVALSALSLALPERLPDVSWRLELAGGYTTNAWMATLADDRAARGLDGASPLLQLDGWVRVAPDLGSVVRPLVEVQVRGLGLSDPDVRELSLVELGARAGLVIGTGIPRATLAYRTDDLLLARGDRYDPAPTWYYGLHRGEVEVEATRWLTVFAGAGRRAFREQVRSRTEADLGVGGRVAIATPVTLLWAASGRMHRARDPVWGLWGGSLLAAVNVRLPRGLLVRGSASAGLDLYTASGGDPGLAFFGTRDVRRDVLIRVGAVGWSPSWSGVRVGLGYDFSDRETTASWFAYRDHRATVRLAWSGDAEAVMPRAVEASSPPMDWGLASDGPGSEERVQDLLRQDEQVQRSSSCVQ